MAPLRKRKRERKHKREKNFRKQNGKIEMDYLLNMRLDNFVVKGGSLKMHRSLSNIATRNLTVVRGE